ncbi:MAG: hypothetical protein ACM34K_01450 [Bacillota bacterium]
MLYIVFLLCLTYIVWMAIEMKIAPWGYEDSTGFHLGKPDVITTAKGVGEFSDTDK